MDLTRIIINHIDANKVRGFIDALEALPPETIQGDFHTIEAYQDMVTGVIELGVMYHTEEIKNSIRFIIPPGNSEVLGDDVKFEYGGRTYNLKRKEEMCLPT